MEDKMKPKNITGLEKIKYLMMDENIEFVTKWLYLYKSETNTSCYTKVARTIFGEEKIADLFGDQPIYNGEELTKYDAIRNMKNTPIYDDIKDLFNPVEVKHMNWLKKRSQKIRNKVKLTMNGKIGLYTHLYADRYKDYTLEDFKTIYRSDSSKMKLKKDFLKYIENTDINKKKQSERYSVSRDLDKDVYYVTNEGRLAKIKKWLYKKYRKKCMIDTDGNATDVLAEGIIIKPMKLINKVIPKANNGMKMMIASLFEGIKECEMIIDTDFKKAYDPIYSSHQDTDGDKASNYSCMSGLGTNAQNFYGKIHGCKVVRWQTKDGEQVGRCIMYEWKDRRHFIRIYGEYPYHRTMINMLEAQMTENDLFGRNKKIDDIQLATDIDYDTKVMYLDGNCYGLRDKNGKWYVVADDYDFDCKTTSENTLGEELDDTSVCERCGRRQSSDDGYWIDDYFYCCEDCAHEDGWYQCERCGEWVHEDDMIEIDGNIYCSSSCAERAGYRHDNYYDEWISECDIGETDDRRYNTSREGAAEYYGVDADEVEWDTNNACWKRPIKEEEETNQEQNEQ
jgi:hypothetical protein